MEEHSFNLSVPKNITFEDLLEERSRGGRFIFFAYLIPRPWSPIKRISRIYFIKPNDKISKINIQYNLITLLWGWWGLPLGPVLTFTTIKANRSGIDITEDVFDNLTEEDFKKGKVVIRKATSVFIHPSKSIEKELYKCFKIFNDKYSKFTESPVVGYYIDTEDPYYYIGLNKLDLDKSEQLKTEIYKFFFKRTRFEFIDINEGTEISDKLKAQGVKVTVANRV